MTKKLILFGASNSGDEFVQLFRDITRDTSTNDEWDIVGLLDDNTEMIGRTRNGIKVLGNRKWLENNHKSEYSYACCIGNTTVKKQIIEYLQNFEVDFATAIHPSVVFAESSNVGTGSLITAGCIVTTNVTIGSHVIINLSCSISHNSVVGDYCTINPGARVSGDTSLGAGVYVGTNAAILQKLTIGENSIIGGGSLVNKNIPPNVVAYGVPVKIIRNLAVKKQDG